ncbi:glycosyltransferase [Demequina sp. SYSU T00192]|uniref:Glycosyltransferase n=1 Tax=Demequina litoralis TaxID=3051660 RepID=A0ABT8G8Y5_9MICO|nr:glycosyltransferase [Demequina sp. SYSU T00192]MDN4475404.1 glycosyltransferase [Demequina sp. SYSU T00192]
MREPDAGADVEIVSVHYAPEPTGNAPYSTSLARELARRGRTVSAVAAHPFYPGWRIYPGHGGWTVREDDAGVRLARLRHFVPRRPTSVMRLLSETSFGVRASMRRWAPAQARILVSPALFATAVVMLRATLLDRRTPVLVWIQDLYGVGLSETGGGGGAATRVVRAVERWVLTRATRVVAIHERFAHAVERDYGIDPARIDIVRNWTHLEDVPLPDRAKARARLGWSADAVVAVHAGNMGVKQGLDTVVEAAALADRHGSAVRFVMVGNGSDRERLEAAATGVDAIDFVGTLDDETFRDALAAADVLVVNERPGVAEMSVPSKLTSYFTSGRPVVASVDPGGASAEEVRRAGAGVVVPSGDGAALLAAVEEVGADPERAAAYGAAGQRYRREQLSKDAAVDRFEAILDAAIAAPREASAPSMAVPPARA